MRCFNKKRKTLLDSNIAVNDYFANKKGIIGVVSSTPTLYGVKMRIIHHPNSVYINKELTWDPGYFQNNFYKTKPL